MAMQPGKLRDLSTAQCSSDAGDIGVASKQHAAGQLSKRSNTISAAGVDAYHPDFKTASSRDAAPDQGDATLITSLRHLDPEALSAKKSAAAAEAAASVASGGQISVQCENTAPADTSDLPHAVVPPGAGLPPTPPRSPHQQQRSSSSAGKTSDTFHIPVHWPSGCAALALTAPAVPPHMWLQSRAVTPTDYELAVAVDESFDPDKGRRTTGFTDMWTRAFADQNGSWYGYADETKKPRSRGLPGWPSTELEVDKPESR